MTGPEKAGFVSGAPGRNWLLRTGKLHFWRNETGAVVGQPQPSAVAVAPIKSQQLEKARAAPFNSRLPSP